jgi:transcriptional regulator GlxA family with amidase domain
MTQSKPQTPPRRAAVLIYDEVEVLDFAGPFEVFGVAMGAFEVTTVALSPEMVTARNGLRVQPSATAADLGPVDVLVVPGGWGSRRQMANEEMLQFLRSASASAEVTLSVCTGSLMLGAAGLLKGLAATTHFSALDELRALDCAEVLADARVVDNGGVVTTTGISAGLDGALHVVARLVGEETAQATARYMQYDWSRDGVVSRLPAKPG